MRFPSYEQALDEAAALSNIEPEYWDIFGRLHVSAPETKKAVLNSLGVNTTTQSDIENAIDARREREWSRLCEPCLVASFEQQPIEVVLNLPEDTAAALAKVRIRREDGAEESHSVSLAEIPVAESGEVAERRFVRKRFRLPTVLPLGYHDLEIACGDQCAVLRLIVTPDRAYVSAGLRTAGVAVSLYGLRSRVNWGCGDFRDLCDLIDWISDETGAGFVALNPLHAIHNRRPYNTSPYLPASIFYQNFIYLDVESVPDFQLSKSARRLWASAEVQQEIEQLRQAEFVEYERVAALKIRFLKLAFRKFLREYRSGASRVVQFREFVAQEGDLLDRYATYSALDEFIHKRNPDVWVWPDWPEQYRDPDSAGTRAFRKRHWRLVLFYEYLQWQVNLQLAAAQRHAREKGMPIGLYHDLALATDRCGSDLWAYREHYVSGCRVGSPPDDFAPKGQDWAFPPPDAERRRESGYQLFIESLRKNMRHGGALRIDHVMRFFRLFWIPDGAEAADGAYVRDYWEDLLRILALESVRHQVIVVGEDLGTVEPRVREALARFGILSYRLFYFERDPAGNFRRARDYPEQALVSSTTHDLPTLAGFWQNEDIEARRRAGVSDEQSYRAQLHQRADDKQKMLDLLMAEGLLPNWRPCAASSIPELTGELHNAVIGFLASTPSRLMVLNQEDLTKETAQQNLPGTTSQYPNWRRKMRFTLEELYERQDARDFVAMFRDWLHRTGRRAG